MLDAHKEKILAGLVRDAGKEELVWMHGYIAAAINGVPQQTAATPTSPKRITLVYGTETGNSKRVATDLAARAKKERVQVKLASLDQYRLSDLSKEENLFVVISTQGDGEPPVAAQKFYDHIHRNGFRLEQTQFSVLALGDTAYPLFCKTGEEVDAQLEKLGARRIVPIRKCDVDYESDAERWFDEVLKNLSATPQEPQKAIRPQPEKEARPGKKIYKATVIGHIDLHDRHPEKQTYHIELAAGEVDYQPGDSIGIVPRNAMEWVERIVERLGIEKGSPVSYRENEYTVAELLSRKLNIVYLHERTVKKYAELTKLSIPEQKMDLADLLDTYPLPDRAQWRELLRLLPAQAPRIYTIASSPSAHRGELHLTVEQDLFDTGGSQKTGLCSAYLAGLKTGEEFDFFVQKNKRFRLPAADKDTIMIGPGTGIAAFRSFLFERDATAAGGRNWLFFGEDHFTSDFFYQTEFQYLQQTGVLQKISLAFAKDRDGLEMHERIRTEGAELFAWLQSGAYLYLCGEKTPMSVQVEQALLSVIAEHGGFPEEDAKIYFEQLKSEGRYSKDVY